MSKCKAWDVAGLVAASSCCRECTRWRRVNRRQQAVDPRPSNHYESTRTLGALFEIKPQHAPETSYPNGPPGTPVREPPLSGSISRVLRPAILRRLGHEENTDADVAALEPQKNYDVRLAEEEIAIGMILAKCTQVCWRRERMHRMRVHAGQLVPSIRRGTLRAPTAKDAGEEGLVGALRRAWLARDYGMRNRRPSSTPLPSNALHGPQPELPPPPCSLRPAALLPYIDCELGNIIRPPCHPGPPIPMFRPGNMPPFARIPPFTDDPRSHSSFAAASACCAITIWNALLHCKHRPLVRDHAFGSIIANLKLPASARGATLLRLMPAPRRHRVE
ncbi:hypothetical protein TRAPUB_8378 [Trametes pubescens]|uniref:Uncharacterized protein n=1 Tax=Trametes pubescens TaxID=154538 RepID=A0A1M2W5C7_TRAPU|nr:hypothetical protein TRAPUB_8378 [Trametes pubescens]